MIELYNVERKGKMATMRGKCGHRSSRLRYRGHAPAGDIHIVKC